MSGQHGFARTLPWSVKSLADNQAVLRLANNEATMKLWPHEFELEYEVTLNSESLDCRFTVRNCGEQAFDFTALLHTYFAIGDISTVRIEGLQGLKYRDKLVDYQEFDESRPVIENISCEVDRNYLSVPGEVLLQSANGKIVLSSDFEDLVVWNPWIEKAKMMSDFEDEEVNWCGDLNVCIC